MSETLVLGPLLSLENGNKYVVCFLSKTNQNFSVYFDNTQIKAHRLGILKFGYLYRAECIIPLCDTSSKVKYKIKKDSDDIVYDSHDRDIWEFYVPSKDEKAKFAYESYDDFFSSNILKQKLDMPYSMIILNEFKLLNDEVYKQIDEIKDWSKSNLDDFFEKLYIQKWSHKDISLALASIPAVIMWYDTDIFDKKELKDNEAYQNLHNASKKYFEIFQLRTIKNNTLLTKDRSHFSFSLKFGDYHILALDDKTKTNKSDIISSYLENKKSHENLMILCDKSSKRESL